MSKKPEAVRGQRKIDYKNASVVDKQSVSKTMKKLKLSTHMLQQSSKMTWKLQLFQNVSVKLFSGASQWGHISPISKHLHWLSVCFQVQFNYGFKSASKKKKKSAAYWLFPHFMTHLVSIRACAFSIGALTLQNGLPTEV